MPTLAQDAPDALFLSLPDTLTEMIESERREPFRYCLNTSTIRGQKLPLDQAVDIAAAAGYDAIEPWVDEIGHFGETGGDLSGLSTKIRDLGLTVEGAIGFFNWMDDDPAVRAAGLAAARRSMNLVARIGGKRIAAPAFGVHTVGSPRIDLLAAAERYADLLAVGVETGVTPLVEVWGFSANLSRLGEAALIATECGHPDACILCDIYHLYKGGSPIDGLRHLRGECLPLFHVNDYPAIDPAEIADKDRVYPGDGIAPLIAVLRALRDIDFRGHLSLELFNADYWAQEPLTVARTGLEKLKAVVADALD